jgi:hypothetical protein
LTGLTGFTGLGISFVNIQYPMSNIQYPSGQPNSRLDRIYRIGSIHYSNVPSFHHSMLQVRIFGVALAMKGDEGLATGEKWL